MIHRQPVLLRASFKRFPKHASQNEAGIVLVAVGARVYGRSLCAITRCGVPKLDLAERVLSPPGFFLVMRPAGVGARLAARSHKLPMGQRLPYTTGLGPSLLRGHPSARWASLTDDSRAKILGLNAARLFRSGSSRANCYRQSSASMFRRRLALLFLRRTAPPPLFVHRSSRASSGDFFFSSSSSLSCRRRQIHVVADGGARGS